MARNIRKSKWNVQRYLHRRPFKQTECDTNSYIRFNVWLHVKWPREFDVFLLFANKGNKRQLFGRSTRVPVVIDEKILFPFAALQMNGGTYEKANRWISLYSTVRSLTVSIKLHASLYNIDSNYLSVQIIHSIDRPKAIQTIPSIDNVLCGFKCEAIQFSIRLRFIWFDSAFASNERRGNSGKMSPVNIIISFFFFFLCLSFKNISHSHMRWSHSESESLVQLVARTGRVAWIESF